MKRFRPVVICTSVICAGMVCLGGLARAQRLDQQQPPSKMRQWMEKMTAAHDIRLKDWRPESNAVVPVTRIQKAKYPIIDVHKHVARPIYPVDPENIARGVRVMDQMNVQAVVNLTGGWGDQLRENIENLSGKYPGRFIVCTLMEWSKINEPGFSEQAAQSLEEAYQAGARCLKISKFLGLYLKDNSGQFVAVNDRRLDPVWAKCGELKMPVLIHTADPIAFFRPWDEKNESYLSLIRRPEWYFNGKDFEGTPRYTHEELMRQRNAILQRHPKTQFVGLHYASLSHDLAAVGRLLDRYPNLTVEMGARNWALGSVPNSGRRFALQYQDRILFGTDGEIRGPQFAEYIRTLETDDDRITFRAPRPWGPVHGVNLPDGVLRKIYHDNAQKLFPFLD